MLSEQGRVHAPHEPLAGVMERSGVRERDKGDDDEIGLRSHFCNGATVFESRRGRLRRVRTRGSSRAMSTVTTVTAAAAIAVSGRHFTREMAARVHPTHRRRDEEPRHRQSDERGTKDGGTG